MKKTTVISSQVTVKGMRTTFSNGNNVAQEMVILKLDAGIFSKELWIKKEMLANDSLNSTLVDSMVRKQPVKIELTVSEMKRVKGKFRTYEANIDSVTVPLSSEALAALSSSRAITKS